MLNFDSRFTVVNAKSLLDAGLRAIDSGQTVFDLLPIKIVDSAAVATMLAWKRAARQRGKTLRFENLPENLHSLVELYDVTELLASSIA